jgi:hypothetical protein
LILLVTCFLKCLLDDFHKLCKVISDY